MKKIVAFTGSSNPDSINEKLVKSIIRKFPEQNIEFIDLKTFDIPIYSQKVEREGIPKSVKKLYQMFNEAEAFILASPEHNGLPSAFLKNNIDWLSRIDQRFFGEKPILLLSTSPGATGGKTHLQILAKLIQIWGGVLVGQYSLGNFQENFDDATMSIKDAVESGKLEKALKALLIKDSIVRKNNVEVVKEYFNAFGSGDMKATLNVFHPDCYIVSVKEKERMKKQLHGIYRTRKEASDFLKNIDSLFITKDFSIERVMEGEDNWVVANGTFSHEVKATGKLFNSTWVQLCKIEDEKIIEYRFYEDSAAYEAANKLAKA